MAMQIDPAALSNVSGTTSLSALSNKALPTPLKIPKSFSGSGLSSGLSAQLAQQSQRIDYEPLYAELKGLIGPERWVVYKEAFTLFLVGQLNQNEFYARVNTLLSSDPKIEHLHNRFICAIIANLTRELPDHGVAAWVSANDKPLISAKPVSGNAAQQRLKTEVMQLPPRDRRRLKGIIKTDASGAVELIQYANAKQILTPENLSASAGGLSKTNWELEIRKRYAQPLGAEIGEFPDMESISARINPICYEESVPLGASSSCADYVSLAADLYIKEFLSEIFRLTRCNAPTSIGVPGGVMTHKYRKQLAKETLALARGELSRDHVTGMLPVEAKEAAARPALGIEDFRLALNKSGGGILGHFPILRHEIMGGWRETEEWDPADYEVVENNAALGLDTTVPNGFVDAMDVDDTDFTSAWEGATKADRDELGSILDECLAIGSAD